MIKTLHLGNFKAFASTQRIPIRPITLIFGANSAGKSSIIHSLALAYHASETGDLDVEYTDIGGEAIDLGGFAQYVHGHDTNRHVEWGMELDAARVLGGATRIETIRLQFLIGQRQRGSYGVTRFTVFADEEPEPVVVMSHRSDDKLGVDRMDIDHPFFSQQSGLRLFEGFKQALIRHVPLDKGEMLALLQVDASELFPRVSADVPAALPDFLEQFLVEGFALDQLDEGDVRKLFKPMAVEVMGQPMNKLADQARDALKSLHYLGPLRSYPSRRFALASEQDSNWDAGGGHAWDELRKNPDVRAAVNEWLRSPDRLSTPFELVTRDLVPLDQLRSPLRHALEELRIFVDPDNPSEDDLADAAENFAFADIDEEVERVIQTLAASDLERLTEIRLRDLRSNTLVSHRDVGMGISQILPVLVNAFSLREQLIAIEQPEIHIHPRLQAELGDVFITSALGEQRNRFLLETHSEHLILRVLRRIRQTTDGELPPGIPEVRPEDVAVLYVEPGEKGSQVIEIPVTSDGEFARRWPNGFFAERLEELL